MTTTTEDYTKIAPTDGFSVVHAPIPEIKVALVGPFIAGAAGPFRMILLTCLGLDISCTRVFLSPGEPAAAFWNRVLRHHRACCEQPLAVLPQRSTDSWEGVGSLQTWRSKPLQQEHLKSGLAQISAALNPDFSALLMQQPSINFIMTGRLLRLAHAYGTNAMKYAVQAVATEPLGLLHFAVSGLPKSERILETIFSGESLPSALNSFGVKKSVLRRAQKSRGGVFAAATPTDVDRVRRAWAWVERMQFLSRLPENLLDSPDFPEILDGVESFGVDEENDIDLAVLIYCTKPGRGFASFQRLAEVAINLEARSNSVPGRALSTNEAFSLALCRDTAVLRRLLGKLEMTALLDRILAQTPLELCQSDATLPCLAPLASTESAIDHGLESETCIKNCEAIFDYVLSGKILYSVRNAAGAVGTAAFQLQDGCKVVLVEVSGRANTEAPIDVLAAAKRAEDAALNAPAALRKFQLYLKNRDRLLSLATKRCAERLVALKH